MLPWKLYGRLLPLSFSAALFSSPFLQADEFPTVYNSESDKSAKLISAEEAAASFQLPRGFEVSVFASEPDVQNPIGMAWDHRGRLWIAENYTYAERKKRFELELRDRVLIFEDTDWDGIADKRTVFTDDVQMLTSVEVGRGGAWLMCPPQLLFIPDADGDGRPDGEARVVLDGFTVAKSNYHNFANGLRWGPDGWLYGRCGHSCPGRLGIPGTPDEERVPIDGGIWRYHPDRKIVEVLTHGTTNPWGHDWDKHGELFFINTVNGHLWHMIQGAHFKESFGQSQNPYVFERLDTHADHWHYDKSGSWTKSRHGAANDFGGGHAHIGMLIYQAGQLPITWRDKLLTWNMHGRRANVERLERRGSGYVGRHEPDAFLSGDTWFRGIDLQTGPDGAIYAIDWSDTGECHEATGVHRESGRIFRISHGKPEAPDLADLETMDAPSVLRLMKHENAWFERQARNRLAALKQPPQDLVPRLVSILASGQETTVHRLRALWMLRAMQKAGTGRLIGLLSDQDEHMRIWAIRLLTENWPIDTLEGPRDYDFSDSKEIITSLEKMASDPSPLVRLAITSAMQRLPLSSRFSIAAGLTANPKKGATDHNLPLMVWYGLSPLAKEDPNLLEEFVSRTTWPGLLRWSARALTADSKDQLSITNRLLGIAYDSPENALPILDGINDGYRGVRIAPRPDRWNAAFRDRFSHHVATEKVIRELGALFGDGRAIQQIKDMAFDGKAELKSRELALQSLLRTRPEDLREICENLLGVRHLNKTAVRGLEQFNDPEVGKVILMNYRKFHSSDRSVAIGSLVTRPTWASGLLDEVARKKIPRADISPFHARQILSLGDEALSQRLTEVWGELRTTSREKRRRIEEFKKNLTPEAIAGADLSRGRVHYQALCASCHKLYGEGGMLGPDLTGSGRANLDYLLENLVDPSAVVSAEYQMTLLTLKDGRQFGGVVAAEDKRTLTLRLLTEESVIEKAEIEKRLPSPASIMPEGQLETLTAGQVRDLIAYLMHPRQVSLPLVEDPKPAP